MPGHEDAGMERIQLLKIEISALELEKEVGLAEAALQESYAEDPAFTRFWSWRLPAMAERLQVLRKEHDELQAEVVMKVAVDLVIYEKKNEERARGEERGEKRKEMPPQQQQRDPSNAMYELQLVDPRGSGGEGTGVQQLQRQQLLQSQRPQEEQQSEDCCACQDIRGQLPPPLLPPLPPLSPPLPPSTPPPLPPPLRRPPLPPFTSSPPLPPSWPPLPLPPSPQNPSTARPMPETVGLVCAGEEESKREGVSWPARGARGGEDSWKPGETLPPRKEEKEGAKVGAGGRVCIVGWEEEHGRKRRRCPKRERIKEK